MTPGKQFTTSAANLWMPPDTWRSGSISREDATPAPRWPVSPQSHDHRPWEFTKPSKLQPELMATSRIDWIDLQFSPFSPFSIFKHQALWLSLHTYHQYRMGLNIYFVSLYFAPPPNCCNVPINLDMLFMAQWTQNCGHFQGDQPLMAKLIRYLF